MPGPGLPLFVQDFSFQSSLVAHMSFSWCHHKNVERERVVCYALSVYHTMIKHSLKKLHKNEKTILTNHINHLIEKRKAIVKNVIYHYNKLNQKQKNMIQV